MPGTSGPDDDPVRRRRKVIAVWTRRANRGGYLFFLLAIVLFVVAFSTNFSDIMATLIIASLVVGSIFLAPAIVLGYAIKDTERGDRSPRPPE